MCEDVKIVEEVKTLYRVQGKHQYYLSEKEARAAGEPHKCRECGAITPWELCRTCREQRDRQAHLTLLAKAPEWSSKFPIIIQDERFFSDNDALIEWLIETDTNPLSIDEVYECTPVMPADLFSRSDLIEYAEQDLCEGIDCPEEVVKAIDEFLAKLELMTEPVQWIGSKLVRTTLEQRLQWLEQLEHGK